MYWLKPTTLPKALEKHSSDEQTKDGMPCLLLKWAQCTLQPPPLNVSVHKVCTELYRPQELPTDCLTCAHCCTPTSVNNTLFRNLQCSIQENWFQYHKKRLHVYLMFNISSHTHILKKCLYWNIINYLVIKTTVYNRNTKIHLETWSWVTSVHFTPPNINFNLILPHTCIKFYIRSEVLRNFQTLFPTPLCISIQY